MDSQKHKEAAELLLKEIPHASGVLGCSEQFWSDQITLAQVHATLALVPDSPYLPEIELRPLY